MAFRFSALARSRIASTSACCFATGRLLRLGQSMLATVDTQAARNSRGAGGGWSPVNGGCATGCVVAPGVLPAGAGPLAGVAVPLSGGTGVVQAARMAEIALAAPAARVSRLFELKLTTNLRNAEALYCTYSRPNAGSTLISAVMMKAGMVAVQAQMKKCGYPRYSWMAPLAICGTIMPSAMKPVQIA